MKNPRTAALILSVLVAVILPACKKDRNNPGITPHAGPSTVTRAEAISTAMGQVIQYSIAYNSELPISFTPGGFAAGTGPIECFYSGNKLIKASWLYKNVATNDTLDYRSITITYNAASQFDTVKYYQKQKGGSPIIYVYVFSYSGNQVNEIKTLLGMPPFTGAYLENSKYVAHYSGNSIAALTVLQLPHNDSVGGISYYANPTVKNNLSALTGNWAFCALTAKNYLNIIEQMPLCTSENAIDSFRNTQGNAAQYAITTDSVGRIVKIGYVDNSLISISYTY
jgi:hypothetical protein